MSETIIIESNRQIAYKQEKKSLVGVNERNANVILPNNKWQTRLEAGVKIEVGDQIQVEAVMVNTRGSPEETIEFSGVSSVQDASDVIDNKVLMRFQKYITNRQQFNCNLPLFNTVVQKADAQSANYGYISLSSFENFKKSYPYRGIEGMVATSATEYAEVYGGGVFTKPPAPLDVADPTRLYLGSNNFAGYGNVVDTVGSGAWDFQTTDVKLQVATGFNTPSKVGESLTAQLHQRQGIPTNWSEQRVSTSIIDFRGTDGSGSFVRVPSAGITDNSYQTVPTATGDIFNAKQESKWSAGIAGEVVYNEEGLRYQEGQGNDVYHRNLLCGNPYEYRGVYPWLVGRLTARSGLTLNIGNYKTTGLYTGSIEVTASDVGNHGLNTVLLDQLDSVSAQTFFTYHNNSIGIPVASPFLGTATLTNIDFLLTHVDGMIVTNNVYNEQNLNNFTIAWTENEVPIEHLADVGDANPLTPNLTKDFYQNLYYGRANDELSCAATGCKINLPNTNQFLNNAQTTPTSYQNIDILGKKVLVREAGQSAWNSRNHIKCWSRYDPFFDQTKPNAVQFTFPTHSKFQLKDSNGNYYPQTISKTNGLAIIPVFYKEADLPHPNLKDIPFCAFVSYNRIDETDRRPAPMLGEFFGRSPSMYDNMLAKVISTQKTSIITDTSSGSPVPAYPPGNIEVRTRTYQYMPYCMIGADNPSIAFDDTYGRFTISGLHTALRAGNGIFQDVLQNENTQASTESMCAYSRESAICGTDGTNGEKTLYSSIIQSTVNNSVISSQSGISIQDIFLYAKNGNALSVGLDPRTPINYEGSLFSKLGFRLEQLLPYVGQRQSNFNRGTYNEFLGTDNTFLNKYNTMVKPFTTNAYISGADQLSMVENARNQEMANLGGNAPNQSIFINATSDSLVAVDLPAKLDYSYLIIYSNIVQNTQFYGGGNGQQKIPAMAYVSRNYSTGDFFFGQESSWTYVADKEYILTEFDTNITLPNGLPAPIENNSSIIYKITKPKILPPPLEAFAPGKPRTPARK